MRTADLVYTYRKQLSLLLLGISLVGAGIILTKIDLFAPPKVEVIEKQGEQSSGMLVVDISGAVVRPGVYEIESGSRISDVLEKSGGFLDEADIEWVDKNLNKAAYVADAQKIYIPAKGENELPVLSSSQSKSVNINTASLEELESLWGIGRVTGENIIEQRPYSSVDELISKKILKQNVYDRNKDILTVY